MNYRKLGRTGIEVSEIGFGAWGIGGEWGARDDAAALLALRRAFDLGITFYDTAHVYGEGRSETLIGEAFDGMRDKIVIASKVPPKNYNWPVRDGDSILETFPADWIVECTEESLRRLRTDYLDVQQLHAWAPEYTQLDEWYDALIKLKDEGKIRAFGVSVNDWDPYGGIGLVDSGRTDTVQVIYNIFEQRPAESLLPAAIEGNVGIIVRVPFEEGLLTGHLGPDYEFDEGDWRAEWLTRDRLEEAAKRVDALKPFVGESGPASASNLAELALRFCLSHPAVSTVIPGMRRPAHVEENVRASEAGPLQEHVLNELKSHEFVHGWAYPWSSEPDPVSIGSFMGDAIAHLVRARLEAAGIEVFVVNENASSYTPIPTEGVMLQVRAADAERALEILAQVPLEDDTPEEEVTR
ncbi:MAG: aldo/keto reductase [FCB group bacterium]|jgi:aryl-alcohol dehydrogenase-like predicted oxidoreductase|nr:aldo/keto reductase [FCB group bacterium]